MIAKSIASETEATTILISAEMIQQRNDIKSAFRLARKLAPTLIIIEDIDTAGTVSRRFADHLSLESISRQWTESSQRRRRCSCDN